MTNSFAFKTCLLLACILLVHTSSARTAEEPIRVLFVGGDWKSQLTKYHGTTPLRGHFVRGVVDQAAPGQFTFTLWTSYEFLQYAEPDNLKQFDVIVAGDVMGQSVLPRLVSALDGFVADGGGFLYCDNHKAFSFNTRELSFDDVLPIEVQPFRPYEKELCQPICNDKPLRIAPAAADHPIMKGLSWNEAPPLQAARYGKLKPGATVLARSPSGKDIWVAWEHGKGRAVWLGGVFANDELSEQFSAWPEFGKFYSRTLEWLAAGSRAPHVALQPATASAIVTIDFAHTGPAITAAHFGIQGQEKSPGDAHGMEGADLALYQDLHPAGAFARTGIASPGDYVKTGPKGQYDYLQDGVDLSSFDESKYHFAGVDSVLADIKRLDARPITLAWCPWSGPNWPEPQRYTKYFAAFLQHANGNERARDDQSGVNYFEVMNEPNLDPVADVLPRYADFFNYASKSLRQRYPGVKFGCGGFFEWSYIQRVLDQCGANVDWISRHPYGHTGEAVFYLQDRYADYARQKGLNPKFIVTEWDFWIYGEPAFDYIMQRWKPVADHADSCLGTLQYRWREYEEGGYVFGVHGEDFHGPYGELPAEWPNPGKDKPITYRYNAFWLMRDCRGVQFPVTLQSDELKKSPAQRAYAVATSDHGRLNLVIYFGYPQPGLAEKASYESLKVHLQAPLPPSIAGRTLHVERADARQRTIDADRPIAGNTLELDLTLPARSGVSVTVQ